MTHCIQEWLPRVLLLAALFQLGCAAAPEPAHAESEPPEPPPAIRAWMDRLTVPHEYDPATGFIVARATIALPDRLANAPALDEAVRTSRESRQTVIAFATADRCAPCQQFKKDALHDPRVLERLDDPRLIATHVEVDRNPDLADAWLGGRAIPVTYALRDGRVVATLRGQRPAEELLRWLDEHAIER